MMTGNCYIKTSDARDKIEKKLRRLDELPTLPNVISKIVELSADSSTSASEITGIISHDQSLTSKILKLVNSSFYGFPRKICTVNHAVVIIGFNEVKNLAIAASAFSALSSNLTIDRETLWRHSAACAVMARMLARQFGQKDSGEYFAAGLLHDIGMVFLATHMPEELSEIIGKAQTGEKSLIDIEEDVLGVDHAFIGGKLADNWCLPVPIKESIKYHHKPRLSKENPIMSAIVGLACTLCNIKGIGWVPGKRSDINEGGWEILRKNKRDLDDSCIDRFLSHLEKEFDCIDELLSLLQ